LLDEQDIKEVLFKYVRGIDRIDDDLARTCFHPGATVNLGAFRGPIEDLLAFGATQLQAKGKDVLEYEICSHPMFQNYIEFADDDLARCESYMMSISRRWVKGQVINAVGVGRLIDRFERKDGAWKIMERTMVMDQYFEVPPETFDLTYAGDSANRGKLGPDDPLYSIVPELYRK